MQYYIILNETTYIFIFGWYITSLHKQEIQVH